MPVYLCPSGLQLVELPFVYCHFLASLKFDLMLLHSRFFFFFFCNLLIVFIWEFCCDVYCIVKHLDHVTGALWINKWWLRGCIMSCFGFRMQVSKVMVFFLYKQHMIPKGPLGNLDKYFLKLHLKKEPEGRKFTWLPVSYDALKISSTGPANILHQNFMHADLEPYVK